MGELLELVGLPHLHGRYAAQLPGGEQQRVALARALALPALLEIADYFFVNAMTTVSAVVFCYSAQTRFASVAFLSMDDAGDTAAAAAMSMLIVAS